ncbi:MAG: Gfo/Idh/MocA family protein [Planctomycetota bacterium]
MSRRSFIKAAAAAGASAGSLAVPRIAKSVAPNGEINVGLIGVGIRGYALHDGINQSDHVRLGGISDISDHYIERIKPRLEDPKTPIHRDYHALLDDGDIDAVVIASPDHWHAQMTLDAMDAGKDVYVEKPMTYSFDEAVRVREAARESGRVTQVGYQRRTLAHFYKARDIIQSGILGDITQIQLWSSRNRPTAPWRAYDTYSTPGLPEKSGPEHVDWKRFQANRPPRPYDPRRFFHWQCYEEYSTGIFGILMSHPLDAANLVMGLDIPDTCSATGGIFQYDDGRTVPDTCNALFNYPSRNLTISFVGSSNNAFFDREAQYRGTHGTMELGPNWLRLYAEQKNALFKQYVASDKADEFEDLRARPIHKEPTNYRWSTTEHLDDFFENVKSRGQCKAPIQECFKVTVALAMAIQSYKRKRTACWNADQHRIVI